MIERDNQARVYSPIGVERPALSKEIVANVRDAILSGHLKAGQKIDQGAIAESMGVSKLPVREALIALASEGVVEIKPRRGAFVSALTEDDILDHYVIFGRVAGLAAERAALSLSDDAFTELSEINSELMEQTDPVLIADLNAKFHRIISRAGGSKRVKHVLRSLSEAMPTSFFEFTNGGERRKVTEEHDAILSALTNRDPDAANRAMARHFENRGKVAQQALRDRGFWS